MVADSIYLRLVVKRNFIFAPLRRTFSPVPPRFRRYLFFMPLPRRVCWMAWIADPDGNRICLHSRKDGSAG